MSSKGAQCSVLQSRDRLFPSWLSQLFRCDGWVFDWHDYLIQKPKKQSCFLDKPKHRHDIVNTHNIPNKRPHWEWWTCLHYEQPGETSCWSWSCAPQDCNFSAKSTCSWSTPSSSVFHDHPTWNLHTMKVKKLESNIGTRMACLCAALQCLHQYYSQAESISSSYMLTNMKSELTGRKASGLVSCIGSSNPVRRWLILHTLGSTFKFVFLIFLSCWRCATRQLDYNCYQALFNEIVRIIENFTMLVANYWHASLMSTMRCFSICTPMAGNIGEAHL